jgi:ribosomal protein S11
MLDGLRGLLSSWRDDGGWLRLVALERRRVTPYSVMVFAVYLAKRCCKMRMAEYELILRCTRSIAIRAVAAGIRASSFVASWHSLEEATIQSCVDCADLSRRG